MSRQLSLALLAVLAVQGRAAEPLTIQQAIDRALRNNGAIEAGKLASDAAGQRIRQAQGVRLPQVQYSEIWARSNNPVFVFSSLLTQRQFTASNFDITRLNNPSFINNFQSMVTVDQTLFDAGRRRADIQAASLGREAAGQQVRRTELEVIGDTIRAYYGTVSGQAAVEAARQAVRSAQADVERAANRQSAGMITEADVLALRVHLSGMREIEIRALAGVEGARAALNQVLGESLDAAFDLTTPLDKAASPENMAAEAEGAAIKMRPEVREAELGVQIAEERMKAAKAALLPEFFFRAGFEADRQRFVTRGGANWLASAGLRWTLFNGFADRSRVAEASAEAASRRAMARYVASGAQVETRRASLELRAAGQRVEVAGETIKMAEEALRIIKNRYDSGLADVTELIRSETALADSRMRYIEAVRDQRFAMLAVEQASGTLSRDSRAIQ